MKTIILTALLFCSISGIITAGESLFTGSGVNAIPKSSISLYDTATVNNLIRTGFLYLSEYSIKPVEAKACIDSVDSIFERENIETPSILHLLKAEFLFYTGDYTKSSEEATLAMEKAKNSGETKVLARTLLFLGKYSLRTGFYKESLDHFAGSIALSTKNNLKGIIPKAYEGESSVYYSLHDYKNYQKALQSMIDEAFAEKDSLYVEKGYSRLGTLFTDSTIQNRNFRMADSLLRSANKISLIRKDTSITAFTFANLGWNFYTVKMYDSSLAYYNKSLKYSLPGRQYSTSANSYGNIGTIYRDLGYPDKAVAYYLKAIELAKKVNHWYSLSWIYHDMSDMYLMSHDTSEAFKSYVLYKKFDDSLKVKESSQGLANARIRYEADSHNKEVQLLSLKLKNNRLLNYGFAVFIILTFAIGLLLLRGSKLKAKRRISEMNRKISEITQANLRQQMNPHFIFNTLNSIQYYMYQHDKLATNNYLTKFSNLMRKVLENSQHTSVPLRDELNALNLYLELESIRFKDKFDYEINVDEEIDTIMYKVPAMLIQPYVENSISHGLMPKCDRGFVKIDIKLEKDYLICTIEDNGIGRAASQGNKSKQERNHNSLGTQIVSSRLDLVNTLYGTSLKTIYTDLKKEDGEPAGTRVEIHIPIMT